MTRNQQRQQSNQVRIIGGSHRSRIIDFPDQDGLRPTSDRIRETLFNWLQNKVEGSRCLDLFAGSGALGMEALSRGAANVQFVESNLAVARSIESNLSKLGFAQGTVAQGQAESWLAGYSPDRAFDIVFLDPPYAEQKLTAICKQLSESHCVKQGSLVYLENDRELDAKNIPVNWKLLKEKKAGQVYFYLLESES